MSLEMAGATPDTTLAESLVDATEKLEKRFGSRVLERLEFRGELTYVVAPDDWFRVLSFCRSAPALAFDQLDCLLGDHVPERTAAPFAVVAHLTSHTRTSPAGEDRACRGAGPAHRYGHLAIGRV